MDAGRRDVRGRGAVLRRRRGARVPPRPDALLLPPATPRASSPIAPRCSPASRTCDAAVRSLAATSGARRLPALARPHAYPAAARERAEAALRAFLEHALRGPGGVRRCPTKRFVRAYGSSRSSVRRRQRRRGHRPAARARARVRRALAQPGLALVAPGDGRARPRGGRLGRCDGDRPRPRARRRRGHCRRRRPCACAGWSRRCASTTPAASRMGPAAWVRTAGGPWQVVPTGAGGQAERDPRPRSPAGGRAARASATSSGAGCRAAASSPGRCSASTWAASAPRRSGSPTTCSRCARCSSPETGGGLLAERVAALCAEPEAHAIVAERVAHAVSLERAMIAGHGPAAPASTRSSTSWPGTCARSCATSSAGTWTPTCAAWPTSCSATPRSFRWRACRSTATPRGGGAPPPARRRRARRRARWGTTAASVVARAPLLEPRDRCRVALGQRRRARPPPRQTSQRERRRRARPRDLAAHGRVDAVDDQAAERQAGLAQLARRRRSPPRPARARARRRSGTSWPGRRAAP